MKKPEQEELLNEIYEEMEQELQSKIQGIQNQIQMLSDKRNTIIRANRAARTAMDVMQDILTKKNLDRNDLELLIERIKIYEDHLEIELKQDMDALLRLGDGDTTVNFNEGTERIENMLKTTLIQESAKHSDKVFCVHVISNGDPLEIYTEKDGGVIFRKYSPMGDLQEFAVQMCEAIGAATGRIAAVSDRDAIIALAGAPKRELVDKPNSPELERLMEQRRNYRYQEGEKPIPASPAAEQYHLGVAAPILCQGDLMGCVMLLLQKSEKPLSEGDQKLAQTAAGFLGRQMEN